MTKQMGRHFKVNGIGILPAFGSHPLFGLDGKLNFLTISVLIIGAFTYTPRFDSIGHIPEHAPNEEVFLYEPHETFHLALRKGMPGLAELRLESNGLHELLIVLLPDWIAIQVTPNDYALHVIRQDVLRNAHVAESVDHPNEQIFLLCIGEELHIPLPAVVTNHSEAGGVVFTSIVCLYLRKAPVHLKRLSGAGRVPSPTVSLRFNCMTRGGNKIMVGRDVVLDDGFTTSESTLAKFIERRMKKNRVVIRCADTNFWAVFPPQI